MFSFIRPRARAIFLSMAATFGGATALAQDGARDDQGWAAVAYSGPVKKDSKLLLWFDGHARYRDDASDLGVTIVRPGIGYRVNRNLSLWGGYARVVSRATGREDIEEDRIWQQATFPIGKALGGKISARSRLEQRFRETGDDTGHRFRQLIRWSRPIEGTKFSAIVWDEVFVGLNDTDWGQTDGLDQNRLFVGGGWQVHPNARVEAGYMHNMIRIEGGGDLLNHVGSVTFVVNP